VAPYIRKSVSSELFLLGYVILQKAQRKKKKRDPKRMKAATEAMRNKEMGNYTASRVFNMPQTTLVCYIKDREKSSNEAIKTKLGMKQVLPCEAEKDLLMKRKLFGFTITDVMCLAYQLAVRNRIKNQFCKRNEKAGKKWLKNFLCRHPEISVKTLKVFHSQRRGVSLLN
jgi:hypothetical protein